MRTYSVTFLPDNLTIEVAAGATLMDAMHEAGLYFDFPCGGGKKCGKCRVRVFSGGDRELLSERELHGFIRLACLTKVDRPLKVEFLLARQQQHQILSQALERQVDLDPHLEKRVLQLDAPSMNDTRDDHKRLCDALRNDCGTLPIDVLRRLPAVLRERDYCVTTVVAGNDILAVETGDTSPVLLGMAFDIGTTSIVGYLKDLYTGQRLAVVSALNEQAQFGADVISRIMFAEQPTGLSRLQAAVLRVMNRLIGEAVQAANASREDVYAVTIAGNTVMQHLFLGINPHHIALAPFMPAVGEALVLPAADVHLRTNPAARVFVLPCIGGFIGGDTVAVLLATEPDKSDDIKLVIDIGTNGEIVLGSRDRLFACSTAAGPAFEGAQISCGMRGTTGAIDYMTLGADLSYSCIGGGKPQGICGSALLDAVAGLLELGIIDRKGRFEDPKLLNAPDMLPFKERLIEHEGGPAFLVADETQTLHGQPIVITQRDIRELQMAKGAVATGIRLLAELYGIPVGDISEVLLAGAFGNYLNPRSACALGLIPAELEQKIKLIGNAAGTGAKLALLSQAEWRRASEIVRSVEFVELGVHPRFMKIYAQSMYF